MNTKWKMIEGHDKYLISNTGRVVSLDYNHTGEIRELKLRPNIRNGKTYYSVELNKKNFLVHRLVAKAFVPNPNNYPIINHKDENPSNNIYTNLEWCTYQYNNTYKDRHLKYLSGRKGKKINQYDLDGNFIAQYRSGNEAYRCTNISRPSIFKCANGEIKQTSGYIFKWAD